VLNWGILIGRQSIHMDAVSMIKKWLALGTVTFGIGFGLSLLVSRDIKRSAVSGAIAVPAALVSVAMLEKGRKRSLQDDIAGLEAQLTELQKSKNALEAEIANIAIFDQLQRERQNLETAISTSQDELQKLNKAIAHLESRSNSLKERVTELEKQKDNLEKIVIRLERDKRASADVIQVLREEKNNLQGHKQKLEINIKAQQQQIHEFDLQKQSLQEIIDELEKKKQDLEREVFELEEVASSDSDPTPDSWVIIPPPEEDKVTPYYLQQLWENRLYPFWYHQNRPLGSRFLGSIPVKQEESDKLYDILASKLRNFEAVTYEALDGSLRFKLLL
jgi:peptidoglycan hydrolase CwlO-like protein